MGIVSRTAPVSELIRQAINERLRYVRTCTPGIVKKVSANKAGQYFVDVQPTIMDALPGAFDTAVALPLVTNAPVIFPGTAAAAFDLPVAVGDEVLLVFSDRSIDLWMESAGTIPMDPRDNRLHDLSDAFAIPGVWTKKSPAAPKVTIQVTAKGDVNIIAAGAVRLGSVAAADAVVALKGLTTVMQDFVAATVSLAGHLRAAKTEDGKGFAPATLAALLLDINDLNQIMPTFHELVPQTKVFIP
jgi:hypothetical protein